jgi:hypothetical protein
MQRSPRLLGGADHSADFAFRARALGRSHQYAGLVEQGFGLLSASQIVEEDGDGKLRLQRHRVGLTVGFPADGKGFLRKKERFAAVVECAQRFAEGE